MTTLTTLETISLKQHAHINENTIQEFIFKHPEVLGLGTLTPIIREKSQPAGGRLDLLLGDDEGTRYEVEIQLGSTDPSHIIRTIEYWDTERKRYPQYDHCAVIVAEDITGRFFNVISLFNGAIPLIALQIKAIKQGNDIALTFTKVIDRQTIGTEDEEQGEPTDRNYWNARTSSKMMKNVDEIFSALGNLVSGYELKYNKFYIGIAKNGMAKNFIRFRPHKSFLYLVIKHDNSPELFQHIENEGLEYSYKSRWKECYIKLQNYETYQKHKNFIDNLVIESMKYMNVDPD
ncbi:MAG: hypothetical protein IKW09_00450 [Alphaproteobacteria bacterium]|nr:hypothetical protein [Alphaproteobacteria bacterium]